jgi:plastocyanin
MRKSVASIVLAAASIAFVAASSLAGIGAAGAASTPPVSLDGRTNVHGTKDLSASSKAKLVLEQDDFSFSPTFIKVRPGETLTVTVKNAGKTAHTFTSTALGIDKTVQPGKSAKVKVTIPATGGTIQFHCSFHGSTGMQGAFYTATAVSPAGAGVTPTTGDVPSTPTATDAPAQQGTASQNTAPQTAPPQTDPPQTDPPRTDPPTTQTTKEKPSSPGNGGIAF